MWFTYKGSGNQGGSGGGGPQNSNSSNGAIASANDTGPVGIVTEEPTCERLLAMQNQVAAQLTDWAKRNTVQLTAWVDGDVRTVHRLGPSSMA